jgi:hypothetical protein
MCSLDHANVPREGEGGCVMLRGRVMIGGVFLVSIIMMSIIVLERMLVSIAWSDLIVSSISQNAWNVSTEFWQTLAFFLLVLTTFTCSLNRMLPAWPICFTVESVHFTH